MDCAARWPGVGWAAISVTLGDREKPGGQTDATYIKHMQKATESTMPGTSLPGYVSSGDNIA